MRLGLSRLSTDTVPFQSTIKWAYSTDRSVQDSQTPPYGNLRPLATQLKEGSLAELKE